MRPLRRQPPGRPPRWEMTLLEENLQENDLAIRRLCQKITLLKDELSVRHNITMEFKSEAILSSIQLPSIGNF